MSEKENVSSWAWVATFVATYETGRGEGACDVQVEVGEADGAWFVRTADEAGGDDDASDEAFPTRETAVEYAEAFASAHDEGGGLSATEYLEAQRRTEVEAAEADEDPDGAYWLVDSQTGRPWDERRFTTREAAETAAEEWHRQVRAANPGTQLLWHCMNYPTVADS